MIVLFTIILATILVAGGILIVQKRRKFFKDTATNEQERTNAEILRLGNEMLQQTSPRTSDENVATQTQEELEQKFEEDIQQLAEPPSIRRAPQDRGGKPREIIDKESKILAKAIKEKTLSLHPEVVCWKVARKWFVGIEIQEEYQEHGGIVVTQNGTQIQKDDRGRWILLHASGVVQVEWAEIGYQYEIKLDKPYLIFRLAGQRVNRGRRVRYTTFGSYLVVAPDQWLRNEEISGPARLSPEPVCIDGYQAHYFSLERGSNSKISFLTSTGEPVFADTHASRFELTGVQLSDASEDVGPLFAEYPPRIKAIDLNTWRSIQTIVVGQEGFGRKRWRTHFTPKPDEIEQNFPNELNNQQGGWYFVRFYDLEDTLVESMDFRFFNALKGIVIHHHSPLPSNEGHLPVPIEFIHDSGCAIHLAEGSEDYLQVQRTDTKTVATIPSNPVVWDKTRWTINIDDSVHPEVVILVERIWWAVGDEDVSKVQPHWSDKPITAQRLAFSAISKQVLWLRLPKERWIETILIGFERQRYRSYHVEVTNKYVAIPLSDFVGVQELEDKYREHDLNLWIESEGQELQATLIRILPEKPLPQVSEKPQIDTRPISLSTVKSHIPKVFDYSDTPVDRKCCSTCDFAIRFYRKGIRCTVGTWEEMVDWDTFYFQFATYLCSRWQGEYRGPNGTMV